MAGLLERLEKAAHRASEAGGLQQPAHSSSAERQLVFQKPVHGRDRHSGCVVTFCGSILSPLTTGTLLCGFRSPPLLVSLLCYSFVQQ